jgi:MinD-like ATPase involved in chromosome partitioning or flagellar assembly
LLLAAGRQLALRGLRVVLVDGKAARPTLASSLGLVPQVGWESVLWGLLPLEEAVIESVADRLAVLPWHVPASDPDRLEVASFRIAASLARLARHHDAVLVDLGPLPAGTAEKVLPRGTVARHVDAVVLVQNVRRTAPSLAAGVQRVLRATGIACAGTIQNFAG